MIVLIALISAASNAQNEQAGEVTTLFEHLNVGMQPGAAVMVISMDKLQPWWRHS